MARGVVGCLSVSTFVSSTSSPDPPERDLEKLEMRPDFGLGLRLELRLDLDLVLDLALASIGFSN